MLKKRRYLLQLEFDLQMTLRMKLCGSVPIARQYSTGVTVLPPTLSVESFILLYVCWHNSSVHIINFLCWHIKYFLPILGRKIYWFNSNNGLLVNCRQSIWSYLMDWDCVRRRGQGDSLISSYRNKWYELVLLSTLIAEFIWYLVEEYQVSKCNFHFTCFLTFK